MYMPEPIQETPDFLEVEEEEEQGVEEVTEEEIIQQEEEELNTGFDDDEGF